MMKFTKGFSVKGNVERAFELTEKYVSGMKYKIENSQKPNLLVLKRGDTLGSTVSHKIENAKTALTISFSKKEETVIISSDYEVKVFGIVLASDKSTLESEVEKLRLFLETAL